MVVLTLIDRYLIKKFALSFFSFMCTLVLILIVTQIFRIVHSLTLSDSILSYVIALIVLLIPKLVFALVPICSLLTVLYVLFTLNSQAELGSLYACGLSPRQLYVPILSFFAFVMCCQIALNVFLVPYTSTIAKHYVASKSIELASALLKPNSFLNITPEVTVHVGSQNSDGSWNQLMIADRSNPTIVKFFLAKNGEVLYTQNGVILNLNRGTVVVHPLEHASNLSVTQFETYTLNLTEQFASLLHYSTIPSTPQSKNEPALVYHQAQHQLVGNSQIPQALTSLYTLLFVCFGLIALGKPTAPRVTQYTRIFCALFAAFLMFCYQKISPALILSAPHAAVLVVALPFVLILLMLHQLMSIKTQ